MSNGQCQSANPKWHEGCVGKQIVIDGGFFVTCPIHLCVVTLGDTWRDVDKEDIIRGTVKVRELGVI